MTHATETTSDCCTGFNEIRRFTGEDVARLLMLHFGGAELYIPSPKHLSDLHPLVKALGPYEAERLTTEFKGLRFGVPFGPFSPYRNRLKECHQRHNAGESAADIARALCVHLRTVRRWLSKLGLTKVQKASEQQSNDSKCQE